jgi:hypothetical protein
MFANDRSFDPDTLRMLQRVFEDAVAALPSGEQTEERKTILAARILSLVSRGEIDPIRTTADRGPAARGAGACFGRKNQPVGTYPTTTVGAQGGLTRSTVMPRLMFDCPSTGQRFSSGILTDAASLAKVGQLPVTLRCPACGKTHQAPANSGFFAPAAAAPSPASRRAAGSGRHIRSS